uniref:NADH-ubiquinone oxidoreductase chain 2 n=1 Tax=Poecilocoris druraei TaxID=2080378 RepID=A0A2K9YV25_9HEMI|nr:NADH dehydrogenase subunit 2 [Poecilocoris druraei]QXJ42681.1 NADH dehydrogenase subunit 2 [Poecilocoris druraei]
MNKSKLLFFLIMMYGTILTLSSNSWISMWMGMEMNMIAFIPLMNSKNKTSSEAMMIYLLVQSMSSMMFMFSIMMFNLTMYSMFMNMVTISLLIKLGASPFHLWLPEILTKMSWTNSAILMTWQKIAPLSVLNNMVYDNKIMYLSIILCVSMGALGGLNQMSLRKIMGYSSINHLGWMLSLSKVKNNWMNYLIIYTIMVAMMCWMFHQYNMVHINQVNNMDMTLTEKMTYLMSMMSLGGLPPFLGFLPKWLTIQTLIMDKMYVMITIMIMCSLLSLFYYMRTMTKMMLSFSMMNKWVVTKSNMMIINMMTIVNMSLPLMLIMNMI